MNGCYHVALYHNSINDPSKQGDIGLKSPLSEILRHNVLLPKPQQPSILPCKFNLRRHNMKNQTDIWFFYQMPLHILESLIYFYYYSFYNCQFNYLIYTFSMALSYVLTIISDKFSKYLCHRETQFLLQLHLVKFYIWPTVTYTVSWSLNLRSINRIKVCRPFVSY